VCVRDAIDGATVMLEAGNYTWSEEIMLGGGPTTSKPNNPHNKRIRIVGAGRGSTVLDRKQGGPFFSVSGGGHVQVEHLTITGGTARECCCCALPCLLHHGWALCFARLLTAASRACLC
jgi:hypothetical protein